jgi:hypothetical protein
MASQDTSDGVPSRAQSEGGVSNKPLDHVLSEDDRVPKRDSGDDAIDGRQLAGLSSSLETW